MTTSKYKSTIAPKLANNTIVALHRLEIDASLISHIPPPSEYLE